MRFTTSAEASGASSCRETVRRCNVPSSNADRVVNPSSVICPSAPRRVETSMPASEILRYRVVLLVPICLAYSVMFMSAAPVLIASRAPSTVRESPEGFPRSCMDDYRRRFPCVSKGFASHCPMIPGGFTPVSGSSPRPRCLAFQAAFTVPASAASLRLGIK